MQLSAKLVAQLTAAALHELLPITFRYPHSHMLPYCIACSTHSTVQALHVRLVQVQHH